MSKKENSPEMADKINAFKKKVKSDIDKFRKKEGLTIEEYADKTTLSLRSFQNIYYGKTNYRIDQYIKAVDPIQ